MSLRGLFSYKSPLFFNPNFGLKNSPAKALLRLKCFALCGVRPKASPLDTTNFCVQKFDKKLYFLPAILSLRRSRTVSSFKLASLRRRRTVRGFNPPPRADLTQARNSVQAQLVNVLLFAKTGLVFIAPENVASLHSPTSECVNTSDRRVLKVQLSA